MTAADPYNLFRFVGAQDGVIEGALAELAAGRKRSHWMWFVFPQLRALGRSVPAQFYGIGSLAEARAYLRHPLLGPRLRDAVEAAVSSPAATVHELFGSPDDLKFRSSMTLFAAANLNGPFAAALVRFRLAADPATLDLLAKPVAPQDPPPGFAGPPPTGGRER
jgi:uncharacterized protein (DUF1810 family)